MNKVIWSGPALRHVEAIRLHIAEFNPYAAFSVARCLIDIHNSLTIFQYRGRLLPDTDMRELVSTYPDVIRYRVVGDTVRKLHVRHAARRPTIP